MELSKQELNLIWCALEDALNSDDFQSVQGQVGTLMDKIEKITKTTKQ